MSYRVCIPTAGTGSRLGPLTQYLNKSLVSVANRPILSHQIEQFPQEVEFVIALGHKGHLVREFLTLAYPERVFHFAEVSPFEGSGSGLGLSLLACKEFLQTPFVFISCDTLVTEAIPAPASSWMAYAQTTELAPYRCLAVANGKVQAILEKGEGTQLNRQAYIGLAGIYDHGTFWKAMTTGGLQAIHTGEAHGLRALLPSEIDAHSFTWFDTGNPAALESARKQYALSNAPHILEKANESIWFIGSDVIKFSDDVKFIENRVGRAESLKGYIPNITDSSAHMYRYELAAGEVLSSAITLPILEKLLTHSKEFWKPAQLSPHDHADFKQQCMTFYKNKTFERVALFYKNFGMQDNCLPINGVAMPSTQSLLESLDWDWLADGLPVRFHGDFHFENILWNQQTETFTFLDWRQDFAGDMSRGDIYYDFAKLMHGLIVSHGLIDQDLYQVSWSHEAINYDLHRKQSLVLCEAAFAQWLLQHGYDVKKVWVLTALIYLNIAALHHHPYSLLLYALGKDLLYKQRMNDRETD
jgi:NDP-sugar pyrophosphorylase family protein